MIRTRTIRKGKFGSAKRDGRTTITQRKRRASGIVAPHMSGPYLVTSFTPHQILALRYFLLQRAGLEKGKFPLTFSQKHYAKKLMERLIVKD